MAKYLDPKADLTFKKVFGEHKELLISSALAEKFELGEAKGRAEGRAEGRELQLQKQEQERISNIMNMRALGQPNELIAKFLQLPIEYVKQH